MKLLLDENLSRRLVPFLQNEFPGSTQVVLVELQQASDREIWDYAKSNGYVVVTRDADFGELSALLGHPPQVLWIRTPNQTKSATLNLLLSNKLWLEEALHGQNVGCIELGQDEST